MATSLQPLLILSEARIQDELRRAAAVAADGAAYDRRTLRLVLICIGDYLVGLTIIGFSLHISNGDLLKWCSTWASFVGSAYLYGRFCCRCGLRRMGDQAAP